MKYIKRFLDILSWPVYLCIAAFLLIASPLAAGYRPVVVLSGSMEPAYHVGSVIYYKAAPFEEIAAGNPITFRVGEDGSLVTHRVVEKRESSQEFVTKGDANETADPNPVSYALVAGKASGVSIPYAGYLVTFGKRPAVIAVMAGILFLGMLADFTEAGRKGGKGQKDGAENPFG